MPISESPALSIANLKKNTIATRQVAILCADGVDDTALTAMHKALHAEGAQYKIIAPKLGEITAKSGKKIKVDQSFLIATSVVFDAVYVPGGTKCAAILSKEADARHFVDEAYKHCKPIAVNDDAKEFIQYTGLGIMMDGKASEAGKYGVVFGQANLPKTFINAMKQHRFWEREKMEKVPA